jgi:hypothetical protein
MPLFADLPKLWLPPKPAIVRPAREVWLPPVRLRLDPAFMPGITPVIAGGGAAKSISFIDTAILTTNLTTYSFTGLDFGAAQGDRYIIGVAVSGTAERSLSSATIGGVAARVVVSVSGGGATDRNAGIIIANVPTGTSGAIAVTWSSGCAHCAIGWWRATGLANEVEHHFGSSTADPGVATINTLAGGIAVAGMISASGGTFSWTGASERYDQAIGENSSVHSGADANTDGNALQITADDSGSIPARAFVAASW